MKSFFDQPEYEWRETLFVFFDEQTAPVLTKECFDSLFTETHQGRMEITRAKYAADGRLAHAQCVSPKTRIAVEVVYHGGTDVQKQTRAFYESVRENLEPGEHRQWKRILSLGACYELVSFEMPGLRIAGRPSAMYDPGSLLFLMEKMTRFLGGTAVDPQSGMILEVD